VSTAVEMQQGGKVKTWSVSTPICCNLAHHSSYLDPIKHPTPPQVATQIISRTNTLRIHWWIVMKFSEWEMEWTTVSTLVGSSIRLPLPWTLLVVPLRGTLTLKTITLRCLMNAMMTEKWSIQEKWRWYSIKIIRIIIGIDKLR
jgi:hypothetical protein